MDKRPYVTPAFELKAFNCGWCGAFSAQGWENVYGRIGGTSVNSQLYQAMDICFCTHCHRSSLWYNERMLIPDTGTAPMPHMDIPSEIMVDFEEARSVVSSSPRSAAALLRLSLQKLCIVLGESGKNINEDIASLVHKGLPEIIQQSLDIIRVIGNEQVHPGELDVRDNPEIAIQLFELINVIVEDRISRPKQIADLYSKLPHAKRSAIEKRDSASK